MDNILGVLFVLGTRLFVFSFAHSDTFSLYCFCCSESTSHKIMTLAEAIIQKTNLINSRNEPKRTMWGKNGASKRKEMEKTIFLSTFLVFFSCATKFRGLVIGVKRASCVLAMPNGRKHAIYVFLNLSANLRTLWANCYFSICLNSLKMCSSVSYVQHTFNDFLRITFRKLLLFILSLFIVIERFQFPRENQYIVLPTQRWLGILVCVYI